MLRRAAYVCVILACTSSIILQILQIAMVVYGTTIAICSVAFSYLCIIRYRQGHHPWSVGHMQKHNVCTHKCTYICIYIYLYIYIYIYIYMYVRIYVYTYICTCIYAYMYIHVYIYIYICMCVYAYMYIHVRKYLCIYIYINRPAISSTSIRPRSARTA